MGNKPLTDVLKRIPARQSNAATPATDADDTPDSAQANDGVQLSQIASSVSDVRRELLEITTKLKDSIASAKIDFSRETQRMSNADANRDSRTNTLTRRIDQLEEEARRFDELIARAGQKLSAVSITADSAVQDTEINRYTIGALSGSVELLSGDVEDLKTTLKRVSKKSLTIRWISVLGMLGLVSLFGLYRIVSLPDLSTLEGIESAQAEHTEAIQRIIQYLNAQ